MLRVPTDYPRWVLVLAATFVLAALAVILAVGHFALPIFDDFCRGSANPCTERAPATPQQGLWRASQWIYFNWSGRWLSGFLGMAIMNSIDLVRWYPQLLIALLLVPVLASFVLFRSVFGAMAWQVTLVFWLVYWGSVPTAYENFFQSTISLEANFGPALAFLTWSFAMKRQPAWYSRVLMMICAFGVGGIHELSGMLFSVALAARAAIAWMDRAPERKLWTVLLLAAGAGLAVNVLAPGNGVRAAVMYTGTRTLRGALGGMMTHVISTLKLWIFGDVAFWAGTVWIVCNLASMERPPIEHRHRRVIGIAWLAALVVGYAVPTWIMGGEMAGRTLSLVYFAFVAGWLVFASSAAAGLLLQWKPAPALLRFAACTSLLLFTGAAAFEGNSRIAVHDLRTGVAQQWHAQHAARISTLRAAAAAGQRSVHLPAITAFPEILPQPRDSRDPRYAHNLCLEWFFGIPEVSAEPNQSLR